jgi:hypothetical protein
VLLRGAFLGLVGFLELLAELPLLEDFSFLTMGLLEGLLEEPLVWGRLGPLRLWARARHRAPDRAIGTFLAGALGRALAGALCRAPARAFLEFLGNAPAASLADVGFGGLFGSRGWLLGRRFFGRRLLLRSCLFSGRLLLRSCLFSGRLLLRCCLLGGSLLLWSSFLLLYPAAPGHIIFDHIYLVGVDILFRTKIARGSHVAGVGWYCPVGGWWC